MNMPFSEKHRQKITQELSHTRAIVHFDMDCFFCQVEQLRLGVKPEVPLAVYQWNTIVAVNYPARDRGVKRLVSISEARENCPEIRLVHVATFTEGKPPAYHQNPSKATHKVSLDNYRRASRNIIDYIKTYCPITAKASIDEVYVDLTAIVRDRILSDYDKGKIEWTNYVPAANTTISSKEATGINRDIVVSNDSTAHVLKSGTPDALAVPLVRWSASKKGKEIDTGAMSESNNFTELGVVVGSTDRTSAGWADLQLKYAAEYANMVRQGLYNELGYRCSAGIAHNKMLAKMGSGLNKPNQQSIIRQSQVIEFMRNREISKIPSFGGKFGDMIGSALGAQTAGDVINYSFSQLKTLMGEENAERLYNVCRGIDTSEIIDLSEPQSMSSVKNFGKTPARNMDDLDRWITMNGADIWVRIVEVWESYQKWPRTLTIGFTTIGNGHRTKSVAFPPRHLNNAQRSPDALVNAAKSLFVQLNTEASVSTPAGVFPLSSFYIHVKNLEHELANPLIMERWLSVASNKGDRNITAASISTITEAHTSPVYTTCEVNSSSTNKTDNNECTKTSVQGNTVLDTHVVTQPPPSFLFQHQQTSLPQNQQQQQQQPNSSIGISRILETPEQIPDQQEQSTQESEKYPPAVQLPTQHNPQSTHSNNSNSHSMHTQLRNAVLVSAVYAGNTLSRSPWTHHSFHHASHPPSLFFESDSNKAKSGLASEYETTDSEVSFLKTPKETEDEDEDEDEEEQEDEVSYADEESEGYDSDGCRKEGAYTSELGDNMTQSLVERESLSDKESIDNDRYSNGNEKVDSNKECKTTIPGGMYELPHNTHSKRDIRTSSSSVMRANASSPLNAPLDPGYAADNGEAASSSSRGPTVGRSMLPMRRKNNVYIQPTLDLESAARYGDGYRHSNYDKNDDGALVVASPNESRNSTDNFVPALISATKKKRAIQVFQFQNSVDAPEGMINSKQKERTDGQNGSSVSGSKHATTMRKICGLRTSKSTLSSNQHSRTSSMSKVNPGTPADPNSHTNTVIDERGKSNEDSAPRELTGAEIEGGIDASTDTLLSIAIMAMRDSMSSSQAVMNIKCPKCLESAPAIPSHEWDTHRDWHIARTLQEKELRHEEVAEHFQRVFGTPFSAQDSTPLSTTSSSGSTKSTANKRANRKDDEQKRKQACTLDIWKR